MISKDKIIESKSIFRPLFDVVENFLREASAAFSIRYEILNNIDNKNGFNIPTPNRWSFQNIVNFKKKFPSNLTRVAVNGDFNIKLMSPDNDSSLSLMIDSWWSVGGGESVHNSFDEILNFINLKKIAHKELYVYVTIKNESSRDCLSYSECHKELAINHGLRAASINHKHLLIEDSDVYLHLFYFPYDDVRVATADSTSFGNMKTYLSPYYCNGSFSFIIQSKDESFAKAVSIAYDYLKLIDDFLSFRKAPLSDLYSPPLSVASLSVNEIKVKDETYFTKCQYVYMKLLAVLSINLFKIFNLNVIEKNKSIDVDSTQSYLIDRLRKLCSNPRFYMHKQSRGNITKYNENDITSVLCSLLETNNDYSVFNEFSINNGRADIKLVNNLNRETFVIECKILGSKIKNNSSFMKVDSVSFRKSIYQVRQYLSNNNNWHGFIVIYAFDVFSDVILKCIKHALGNISKQLGFYDNLEIEPLSVETLGLPVFNLRNSTMSVRLIICTLHTKTPTEVDSLI